MTYLDPIRVQVSGDKARALSHVPEARAIALSIAKQVMPSGASSGRRAVTKPDGTTISVVKAGADVSVNIDSPGGPEPVEATIAYVATMFAGGIPGFYIVDVDRQKIVNQISFPSYAGVYAITGIALAPDGAHLFLMLFRRTIIKVDLNKLTASGADIDLGVDAANSTVANVVFTDLVISPDGKRLHVLFTATGFPSGGTVSVAGTYGGAAAIDTKTLILTDITPNHQFSTFDYCLAVHPKKTDLIYFTAYGDLGAATSDDINGASDDSDLVPNSVLYANWHGFGGPVLGGNTVFPFYLSSSRGARRVEIVNDGKRAYVSNTRAKSFVAGGGALVDVPAVVQYDTKDGTLARGKDLLKGVEITGAITTNSSGSKIFVIEAATGVIRVLNYDSKEDKYEEGDSFSGLPKDATLGDYAIQWRYRHMVRGPKWRKDWDKRIFVSCGREKALTAIKFDGKLDKTVLFETTPGILCVGTARRVTQREGTK